MAAARNKRDSLDRRRRALSHDESHGAVDSELMLLWWEKYPLDRWVPNPLYFQSSDRYRKASPPTLMTCRLDGPTPDIAKRLVDDALAVEAKGLTGRVVVDARGIGFDPSTVEHDRHGVRGSIIGRMERHGGRAEIRSHPGEGTEVRLSMPTAENGRARPSVENGKTRAPAQGRSPGAKNTEKAERNE